MSNPYFGPKPRYSSHRNLNSSELDELHVPYHRLATPEESLDARSNNGYYGKLRPDGSIIPAFHIEVIMTTFRQAARDRISKYPDVVMLNNQERNRYYYKEMHHEQEEAQPISADDYSSADDGRGDGVSD